MPTFEVYWRNPEKHLHEYRTRMHHLRALGMTRNQRLSPKARAHRLTHQNQWRRDHLAENMLAARRYRRRMIATVGSSGFVGRWKFKMIQEVRRAKRRKLYAASLD